MNDERTILYIGNGAYISGVPARDLTPAEYEEHREAIEACPHQLYQLPEEAQKPTEAKSRGKK